MVRESSCCGNFLTHIPLLALTGTGIGIAGYGASALSASSELASTKEDIPYQMFICLALLVSVSGMSNVILFLIELVLTIGGEPTYFVLAVQKNEKGSQSGILAQIIQLVPFAMYIWAWIRYGDQLGWKNTYEQYPELTNALFTYIVFYTTIFSLVAFVLCCVLPCLMCCAVDTDERKQAIVHQGPVSFGGVSPQTQEGRSANSSRV